MSKLRLIGKGPSSESIEDWSHTNWGLNDLYEHRDYCTDLSWDVWFQIHPEPNKGHVEDIEREVSPHYIMTADNLRIIYNAFESNYFTSTLTWMLATALFLDEFDSIRLVGFNLEHMIEYLDQRSCAEYWLGRCRQHGMDIEIKGESTLFAGDFYPPDYSLTDDTEGFIL